MESGKSIVAPTLKAALVKGRILEFGSAAGSGGFPFIPQCQKNQASSVEAGNTWTRSDVLFERTNAVAQPLVMVTTATPRI